MAHNLVLANLSKFLSTDATGVLSTTASPTKFDSTTKLATTAFVQGALGNKAGFNVYAATGAILGADAGKLLMPTADNVTLTLPAASSVPVGTTFIFYGNGRVNFFINRAGTDNINWGLLGNITSMGVNPCDTLELTCFNTTTWSVSGGSAFLKYASAYASSMGTSGYQKLPSGTIIQWGQLAGVNNAGATTATFPITFPNGCLNVVATQVGNVAPASKIVEVLNLTQTTFQALGNSGANAVYWNALGY